MLVIKRKSGESIDILDNVDRSKLLYRIHVEQIVSIAYKPKPGVEDMAVPVPSFFIVVKRADGKVISRVVLSRKDCHGVQISFFIPYELTIGITRGNNVHVDISIQEPGRFTYIQKTEKLPYEKFQQGNHNDTDSGDGLGQSPGPRSVERAA